MAYTKTPVYHVIMQYRVHKAEADQRHSLGPNKHLI